MSRALGIIGFIVFAAGLLLALIGGIVAPASGNIILVLVVLGIIVGAVNVITREMLALLVATVALIVVGTAGFEPLNQLIAGLGTTIDEIIYYLARFMAPAAIITAVRTLVRVGFPVVR
jgi:hypothetical protein